MSAHRTTDLARAVVLVALMLTMSMSAGIVDLNRAPWANAEPPVALAENTCKAGGCPFFTSPSVDVLVNHTDVRMMLDPSDGNVYPGSGSTLYDMSPHGNNGTVSGPTWDPDFTRFDFDGSCSAPSNGDCDEISVANDGTLRPGHLGEDLAVGFGFGASASSYLASSSSGSGKDVGALEKAFTVALWVKPTDCANGNNLQVILQKELSFHIGCKSGYWFFGTGSGSQWHNTEWLTTSVPATDDVWQHLAFTRPASGSGTTFHLNGEAVYSVTSYEGDLPGATSQRFTLGASLSSSGSWESGTQFTGWVDDVRIYTADRSSTVAADMHAYPSTSNANLNAFFDFNIERHNDVFTSAANLATASGAAQAGLSLGIGSPVAQRVWSVAVDGTDTVLTFNRTVLTADGGWRVPVGVSAVDALVVGGGGGGGYNTGGGGGGGGVGIYNATSVTASSSMAVIVGHGGGGSTTNGSTGSNGQASQFGTSVVGGGGGGAAWKSGGEDGSSAPTGSPAYAQRGSGGGGANGGSGGSGATDGGDGATNAGAGGGGAGANGSSVSSYQTGADGGAGVSSSITGSSVTYGSGGGGGSWNGAGSGGSGAGNGGRNYAATDGTAHRGGGGGGGGNTNHQPGGDGGSGVVIVRYASVDTDGWTVSAWFNASTLKGSTIVGTFDNGGTTSDYGWAIRMKYNGAVYGVVGTTSNASAAWTGDTLMSANRWYHATLVADTGSTLTMYIDGQQVSQTSLTNSGPLRNVANDIYLGTYNGGEFADAFAGHIGTTTLIAGALSSSGVQALHNATLGPYQNSTAMAYASATMTANQAQTFSSGPINVTNGSLTTAFELVGNLPSGLSFGTSNGTVWGTPMWAQSATNYTVRANNSAGSFTTTFSLTVLPLPPNFVYAGYSNLQFTKGTAIASIYPSNAGGEIEACSVDPALPSGLVLSSSCVLSGTPSAVSSNTTYTVNGSNDGGYGTAQFSIIVNDQIASVSYATPIEIVNDRPLTTVTPTVSGGTPTQWAVSPSLPTGLSFGTGNGSVWGEPTGVTTNSTHTVWANNTGGSATTTLVLAINWSMTPSTPTLQLTRNVTLSPALTWTWTYGGAGTAQVTGASCAIVPTLPAGLTLNQGNCSITGTPTTPASSAAYTLWANRSGSSYSGQIQLGVGLNAPSVTYPASTYVLANNTPFTPIQPVNTGGEVSSWWISGSPLGGFFFGYSNGTIWGSPNATADPTTLTIWANNSAGASSTTITIEVVDPPTGLQYGFANLTLTKGTQMSTVNPVVTGGSPSSWAISPGLPNGLSFSTVTGAIGGTPSVLQTNAVQHTIWANNTAGSVSFTFNLTVNDVQPTNLTYANTNLTLTVGTPVNIAPPTMEGGTVTSWSIDPSLPAGLTFSTSTGRINGTPTALSVTAVTYTVTATNSGGSGFTTFSMGVLATPPSSLSYSPSDIVLTIGQTMTPNVPSVSGGAITEWWISGDGIVGLNFGLSNGTIWGTPDELTNGTQTYMVWANNSGGSTATNITVTVVDEAPGVFIYSPQNTTLTLGDAVDLQAQYNNSTFGNITSWAINSSLPSGVTFHTNNGTIEGEPTELWPQAAYLVWANNSGGSSVAYLNITVVDELPSLSYTPENLTLTKVQTSTDLPLNATLSGSGTITSWAISPALPSGLSFGTSNGTIWGVPTVLQPTATTYTIWANNSGGSTSATITITINDEPPGPFEYIPENNTWTNNSYVNIGPSFINITTGNNSNWLGSQVRSGSINIGLYVEFVVGDVIYFDESYGGGHLYAYNTSNNTAWRVFETMESQTVYDVGEAMSMIAGDIIYFSGDIWSGGSEKTHLYAHNTSNGTTWRVPNTSTYHQGVNLGTEGVVLDDKIYFAANTGGGSLQVWGYNSVNNTAWQATSTSHGSGCCSNLQIVGDTIYYTANRELWAYNTSNQSDWEVAEINPHHQFTSDPGRYMSLLVGDTMYFDADDGSTGRELWAYNTSNETYWRVVDISNGPGASNPGSTANILVGDTIYFNAYDSSTGYTEMWAHTTSNVTTWKATDLNSQTGYGNPSIGVGLIGDPVVIGDTIFFDAIARDSSSAYKKELWAHDTSNHSTWQVSNLSGPSSSNQIGSYVFLGLGDTLYFSNTHSSNFWLWAYDTTNQSVWNTSIRPGDSLSVVVGNTIYLEGSLPISNSFRLIAHQPGSVNHQTNTGGNVITWAINASLPSGVSFNNQTGMISGTPTELWPQTSYMVWANNSGGSSVAYLNFTVVDDLPTITYPADAVVLTVNTPNTGDLPMAPTVSGEGAVVSWAIEPALPAGLSFGTSNGTVWGTPTVLQTTAVTYTVWANNTGGSTNVSFTLSVVDQVPTSVAYTPSGQWVWVNGTLTTMSATVNGPGTITEWRISPTFLPPGVVFNSSTGTVSGTPTEVWANTTYTVEASNSGGSVSTTFWLQVRQQAPSITYNVTNVTLVSNVSSVVYGGTNTGGPIDGGHASIHGYSDVFCAIDAAGQVWCWGENEAKIVNRTAATSANLEPTLQTLPTGRYAISIGVGYEAACALLDNGSVACWGDAGGSLSGSSILYAYDGDGYVDPMLIPGLGGDVVATSIEVGFASACVEIDSGLPQCWGSNAWWSLGIGTTGGPYSTPVNLTVTPSGRTVMSLSHGNTHACALLDNASVMCWGDNSDGQLGDGTQTARSSPVWPDLWGRAVASVEAGHRTTCVGFVDGGAACWGDNSDGQLGDGTQTDRRVPTNVTGTHADAVFTSFALSAYTSCANLGNATTVCWGDEAGQDDGNGRTSPTHVTFDAGVRATSLAGDYSTTCAVLSNASVACWGSGAANNFGVLTTVSSSGEPLAGVLGRDARSNPGGWYFNGTLPAGLQFNPLNGTLWGTPRVVLSSWFNSTVTVHNSAGTSSATFSMRVIDSLPTLSYSPSNLSLVRGVNGSSWPLAPTLTGPGDITSWVIEPALPSGLFFGVNNGTLYGASSVLQSRTAYTVWANNSGGSNVVYLNITVVDQLPVLSYASTNLTLFRDGTNSELPFEATLSGGAATSWAISSGLPSGLTFDTTNGSILGNPQVNASLTSYTIWANNTGGSASFLLNLTVVEPTPGLVYNPVNLTLTRGVAMSPLAPSTYNGVAEEWSIHPALPAGLMFNNGHITGTPSVNLTVTMFTVWANNTQGQASFTLNLTVVEPIVSLSYLPQNLTLYRGIAASTVSPTYSGGAVQTWSIHPSLPAGLTFSNGVISGTPGINQTTTLYTVWANNTGGSTSATLNLTILEPTVVLSYSVYDITLTRNDTALNLQPSVSWGTPTSWSISPALPTGLSFSQGALTGTALVNMSRTMFTVWANNSGGSTAVYLNFTVVEPVVTLTFNPAEVVLVRNASMNPITAGFNGGAVDMWSIHPALPQGLQFMNGVLSGSALDNASRTMYTVWANNSGGASSVMFNLTVTEPMLDFTYTPSAVEAVRGDALTPFGPTSNNDAAVASWGISPALPEGLTFAEGWISGTPVVNSTGTVYTVWANNSGGASTSQFTLTVLEPVAVVTYEPANFTVTRNADALLSVPMLSGGSVAHWTIEPALPAGLNFDNGTVSGVLTTSFPTTMFTVNATNSGGFALAFLNITSVEPLAELAPIEDLVLVRLGERANASINNSGGAVASWAIEPALPSGVRFINGQVYGIARVNLSSTVYTVWANNSGGSVSTTFNLTVLEPRAAIAYLQTEVALVAGKSTVRLAPVVTGGVPGSWAIEPALPEGMTFVNGIISGTPEVNREPTAHTVWANTTGGSASTTLTLSVDLPVYFARYPVSRFVLSVNETLLPQYPVASFDAIQRPVWTISPALPEGMNFSNGVVWGTPLNASNETTYVVNVTGEMAPLALTFTLEVLDTAPVEVPDLTNGTLEEEVFIVPERRDFDTSFGMYYICPPILFSIVIIGAMAINNYLKRTGYIEVETEKSGSEEDPSA